MEMKLNPGRVYSFHKMIILGVYNKYNAKFDLDHISNAKKPCCKRATVR